MRNKISLSRAAGFLECTELKVQELLREGKLPGLKVGKAWVIPREAFYNAVNGLAVTFAADAARELAVEQRNKGVIHQPVSLVKPRTHRSAFS